MPFVSNSSYFNSEMKAIKITQSRTKQSKPAESRNDTKNQGPDLVTYDSLTLSFLVVIVKGRI